jgi:hypothetical protein
MLLIVRHYSINHGIIAVNPWNPSFPLVNILALTYSTKLYLNPLKATSDLADENC